jgi:hypothetical protein
VNWQRLIDDQESVLLNDTRLKLHLASHLLTMISAKMAAELHAQCAGSHMAYRETVGISTFDSMQRAAKRCRKSWWVFCS